MIAIVPADEKTRAAVSQSASFCGEADCLVAETLSERLGFILYRCEKDGKAVRILDIQADDALVAESLLRAAFHIAGEKGIKTAVSDKPLLSRLLLKRLGFREIRKKDKTEYHAEIQTVLHCPCAAKNKHTPA